MKVFCWQGNKTVRDKLDGTYSNHSAIHS